jgi:hypothetical protein
VPLVVLPPVDVVVPPVDVVVPPVDVVVPPVEVVVPPVEVVLPCVAVVPPLALVQTQVPNVPSRSHTCAPLRPSVHAQGALAPGTQRDPPSTRPPGAPPSHAANTRIAVSPIVVFTPASYGGRARICWSPMPIGFAITPPGAKTFAFGRINANDERYAAFLRLARIE